MTMAAKLQPLGNNQPIVDKNGIPNDYFIRWAQQRQIDIKGAITDAEAQQLIDDWAAGRQIIAGVGLDGGGPLSADVTIDLADTAVSPGTYGDNTHVAQVTVDAQGRIIDAVDIPIAGGGGGVANIVAYAHFYWDGTNVILNAAANVAFITRYAQGIYRVNFTTPLVDSFYYLQGSGQFAPYTDNNWIAAGPNRQGTQPAAYADILLSERYNGSLVDAINYCAIVFIR